MNNNDIANANAGAATFSTNPTKQQQQQQEEEEHRSNSTSLQDYDSDDDNDNNANCNDDNNDNDINNDDELSQTTNGTRQSQQYATNGIGGGGIAIPPTNVTVNDSLSKELLKLSLTDRNAMEEEIHGVRSLSSYKVETPTLLKDKLIEFDIELQKVILIRKNKRKKTLQQKQKQKQSKVGHNSNTKTKMKANNDDNEQTTEDTDNTDTDVLRNIIPMQSQSHQSQSSSSSQNTTDDDDEKHQDESDEKKELCYVNDPDVRLRFLRCDSFDSKKAVKRFVSFLEFSTAIFGNFIADRPPKITDVYNNNNNNNSNREAIRALQNSRAQYLPFRDRSGRRIHCLVGKVGFDLEFTLRCKIVMYLHWIASEDIETQQKGIVVIAWPSDEDNYTSLWEKGNLRLKIKKQNTETFKQNFNVALPVRVTSIHFCSKNQPIYKVLSSLFYFSLNTHHKSRYKTHFGDTMEILYKLQSYGIPVDLLPMTYSGTVKTNAHSQWVTFRTTVEQQEEEKQKQRTRKQQQRRARNQHDEKQPQFISSSCNADVIDNGNDDGNANQTAFANTRNDEDDEIILVECPRSYDICFRKGKSFKNNPGNLQFRSLIEETHHSHFMLSDRKDKFDMTLKIADQIMNNTTSAAPRSNGSSNGSSGGAGAGGGGGGGQQMRILEWNKKRNAWLLVNDKFAIRQKVANSYKEYKRSCIGRQNALATSTSTLSNKNKKNANANNANTSYNNANNAKSFSLVEAVNDMTNTNTNTTTTNKNNNNNNSTETSGNSSGGRKNQRQFQQQQQQQKEEQQRDEYMFLQSKRQKIATTIPTPTTPTPTTTASSSFLGEVSSSTNNCTGCFSFHQHQIDGGSGSGSDSGNEDSNYGNNCNNSNKAYNWLL